MEKNKKQEKWKMCLNCGAICFPQGGSICFNCNEVDTGKEEVTFEEIKEIRRLIKLWKFEGRIWISIWFSCWEDLPQVFGGSVEFRQK